MKTQIPTLLDALFKSLRDLTPIVLVIAFFQIAILNQPFPDLGGMLAGTLLLVIGLTLFMRGLEMGLFPLGESLAYGFAIKGNLFWLLLFAFALGFGTTVAEPALIVVANEAALVAAEGGVILKSESALSGYALALRLTVGLSVGVAIIIGVLRIVNGWPIQYFIVGGYMIVVAMTRIAPKEIIGIAYDAGGVTTGTITVPLITALGIGLSLNIRGRNPMIDGFGLIAIASLTPIIFVMGFGMFF